MLDIAQDQLKTPDPEATTGTDKPDLSRKGFIITYPMFRYLNKIALDEGL